MCSSLQTQARLKKVGEITRRLCFLPSLCATTLQLVAGWLSFWGVISVRRLRGAWIQEKVQLADFYREVLDMSGNAPRRWP
jgi:hypothetical protein